MPITGTSTQANDATKTQPSSRPLGRQGGGRQNHSSEFQAKSMTRPSAGAARLLKAVAAVMAIEHKWWRSYDQLPTMSAIRPVIWMSFQQGHGTG